jgi:hypothetical protein
MVIKEIGSDGINWVNLAQDKDKWLVPVNGGMNIFGSLKSVVFLD